MVEVDGLMAPVSVSTESDGFALAGDSNERDRSLILGSRDTIISV